MPFDSASLPAVLREACRRAGLTPENSELLRIGENAIYRLPADRIVIRIARSADRMGRAARELCVARWLAEAGVPAIGVHDVGSQPLLVDGYPVTFWREVSGGELLSPQADLARLLAAFHGLDECPCGLPDLEPLARVDGRIAAATTVDDDTREFLSSRATELAKALPGLEYVLPCGPIHGDAHVGNLLVNRGQVLLSDFEVVSIGPREWDLLPTAIAVSRYGLAEERYDAFAADYGFDVRTWPGFPVLREVRELGMTTWLMQNIGESPEAAAEFGVRYGSLREGDVDRRWKLF